MGEARGVRPAVIALGSHMLPAVAILCFGEAIVDLICERRISSIAEAEAFKPHFGGALANVAVAARRAGAAAALAGGVGDDAWGRWLRARLEREGVDLRWFSLVDGVKTPVAFVTFDREGEPAFQIYGQGIEAGIRSVSGRLSGAVAAASALAFGSNTLVGEPERELTLDARRAALREGIPVLFDPNVRAHRWESLGLCWELCAQLCDGSFLVRCNKSEAEAITAAGDPAEAAAELVRLGAKVAVVTLPEGGAVMRGAAEAEAGAPKVELKSALGAGDAFTGTLAAGLAQLGWDAARAAEALPAAVEAAARTCTHWGAVR